MTKTMFIFQALRLPAEREYTVLQSDANNTTQTHRFNSQSTSTSIAYAPNYPSRSSEATLLPPSAHPIKIQRHLAHSGTISRRFLESTPSSLFMCNMMTKTMFIFQALRLPTEREYTVLQSDANNTKPTVRPFTNERLRLHFHTLSHAFQVASPGIIVIVSTRAADDWWDAFLLLVNSWLHSCISPL